MIRRLVRWAFLAALVLIPVVLVADVWFAINFEYLANISLNAMAGLAAAFTLLYGLRSKWWANRIGRAYLMTCVVLTLVLAQNVVTTWFNLEYPGRQHFRFAIYALGALAYLAMLLTLWREQQRDRSALAPVETAEP